MLGDQKQEYHELNENMRHYGNMRFAQLTLYFAFTAGLVAAVFTADPPLTPSIRCALKIVGMVGSIAFGIMEKRAADHWHHFCKRAASIEPTLGYEQHANRPTTRLLTATHAAELLIWGTVLLWALSIAFSS